MKTNRTVLVIAEISILSALAIVLDYLAEITQGALFIYGGSISIAMVPIMVISFRRGVIPGLVSGFIVGTIQLMYSGHLLHPVQYLLDYPVPYTLVGLAGITVLINKKKNTNYTLVLGTVIAGLLRYLSHFLSGVVFWSDYVPESFDSMVGTLKGFNPYTWSAFYNGLYMIPSIIICAILLIVLKKYIKDLYLKDSNSKFDITN